MKVLRTSKFGECAFRVEPFRQPEEALYEMRQVWVRAYSALVPALLVEDERSCASGLAPPASPRLLPHAATGGVCTYYS